MRGQRLGNGDETGWRPTGRDPPSATGTRGKRRCRSGELVGREDGEKRLSHLSLTFLREAAGIWKWDPSFRSNVVPCLTKRVLTCAPKVLGIKVTSHIKVSPSTRFATSTSVTVQGDSLEDVLMAALSKYL